MRQLSILLLIGALVLVPLHSTAQESASQRKVLKHVAPEYPAIARTIKLHGVVKVEVLVAPDGSVKSTGVRGGHPILAQAALNAVQHWKWEPGSRESHEVVEVTFAP